MCSEWIIGEDGEYGAPELSVDIMVMIRYPKTDQERKCAAHRQRMQALRDAYRQRLINGQESIHTEASKKDREV